MPYSNPEQQKAAQKKHYNSNKQEYAERVVKARRDRQDCFRKIKGTTPCKDCGLQYHYCQMQFDHVRGEKKFEIGRMASDRRSWKDILEEVDKCEVVCANCHALRTWTRIQNT